MAGQQRHKEGYIRSTLFQFVLFETFTDRSTMKGPCSIQSPHVWPRRKSSTRLLALWLVVLLAISVLGISLVAASSASYYNILDIDPSADTRTIKKAYRRLAQRLHPDKFPEKEAEFVKMSEAYQVLSDDELRKIYDRYGEEGVKRHRAGQAGPGGGSHDPFDIFRNFFGGGGGARGSSVRKGPAKHFNIMVSLKDLYVGKTITLEYDRNVVCHKCDGSGAKNKADIKSCEACGGRGVRIVRQEIMPGCESQSTLRERCHTTAPQGRCS